ncbi:MAG: hypothetical protein K2X81_22960, partial [Candidatus Obscuribacterales bacterium]|nr:hypothetical protein [Candidatus Obscuribacterales bacterium]
KQDNELICLAGIEFRRSLSYNQNDTESAVGFRECAEKALLAKASFNNHLSMAGAYLLTSKFDDAENELDLCSKMSPNRAEIPFARRTLCRAVANSSQSSSAQVQRAVLQIGKLLIDSSHDAQLLYILGRLQERLGDNTAAKKSYDEAWAINRYVDPDLVNAYSRIGCKSPKIGP